MATYRIPSQSTVSTRCRTYRALMLTEWFAELARCSWKNRKNSRTATRHVLGRKQHTHPNPSQASQHLSRGLANSIYPALVSTFLQQTYGWGKKESRVVVEQQQLRPREFYPHERKEAATGKQGEIFEAKRTCRPTSRMSHSQHLFGAVERLIRGLSSQHACLGRGAFISSRGSFRRGAMQQQHFAPRHRASSQPSFPYGSRLSRGSTECE